MTLDEEILAEVEVARTKVETLEDEVYEARAALHQSIRRLHTAGGSMREIATALGMSHQRVHQIVGEDAIVEVEAASTDVTPHPSAVGVTTAGDACSFCGAPRREVDKLLVGPGQVFVCDGCVGIAAGQVKREGRERRECSFCRNRVTQWHGGESTTICADCVATCERMLGQDSTKRAAMRRTTLIRCSFCNVSQKETKKLIAGPGVYICGDCVKAASGVASTGEATPGPRSAGLKTAERESHPCSFCGNRTPTVDTIVKGPRARICNDCLSLCEDILAEEGFGPLAPQ